MTFGAPHWLYILALLPLLVILIFNNEKRVKVLLQKIVAARLTPQLAGSISYGKRRLRFLLLLLGIAAVIVSLAQPQFGYTWEQSKRKGRDVILAIDTSKSMLATDLVPNRLKRAKLAAQDLITLLQGDRVGVLAFAGSSFLQAPLTIDYGAVLGSVDELDTNIIPKGGTNIADVIESAAKAFGKGESENRALVLFTDGDELDADGVAAAKKHEKDFRIFTVGVGSPDGALIPVPGDDDGTSFVKDNEGQIVKSKLDETRLRQIAEASGGFYTLLQNGPADMKTIVQQGLGKMQEKEIDARMSRHPIERYQWPLALGLALIAGSTFIGERRRSASSHMRGTAVKSALIFLALCIARPSANAAALNEGVELYNGKKFRESYDVFQKQLARNPDSQALHFDSGAAAYKQGDYNISIDAFSRAIASPKTEIRGKSEYNLANALTLRGAKQESKETKLKDWNNALQHYDEALKIDEKNEDAKFNRDVVKKLIEDLKREEQQKKQDQQKDSKDDKKKDDKQDQKKDQKDDQKKQDNQKKDDKNSNKDQQQQKDSRPQNGNNEDSKDGKDSKQDQSKSDEQKKQNEQSESDGKSGDEKKDDSSMPDQKNDGKQGDSKEGEQKQDQQQNGEHGKNQDSEKQNPPQQQSGNGSPDNRQQVGQQPTPAPEGEDKKFSGDIKDQSSGKLDDTKKNDQGQAYDPGQVREMSPEEAQHVIEAEKDEDAKGVLIERRGSAPVLKDW